MILLIHYWRLKKLTMKCKLN